MVGTLNMLGLAKRVGARFLLTSTSEVYGDPLQHPQNGVLITLYSVIRSFDVDIRIFLLLFLNHLLQTSKRVCCVFVWGLSAQFFLPTIRELLGERESHW